MGDAAFLCHPRARAGGAAGICRGSPIARCLGGSEPRAKAVVPTPLSRHPSRGPRPRRRAVDESSQSVFAGPLSACPCPLSAASRAWRSSPPASANSQRPL